MTRRTTTTTSLIHLSSFSFSSASALASASASSASASSSSSRRKTGSGSNSSSSDSARFGEKPLRPSMRVLQVLHDEELASPVLQRPFPNNPQFYRYNFLDEDARDFIWTLFREDRAKWTPKIIAVSLGVPQDEVIAYVQCRVIEEQFKAHAMTLATESQEWLHYKLTSRPIEFSEDAPESIVRRYQIYQQQQPQQQQVSKPELAEAIEALSASEEQQQQQPDGKEAEDGGSERKVQYMSVKPERQVPTEAIAILDENPQLGNKRFKFVFTETSNKERKVWVRETTGVLRSGTEEEHEEMKLPDMRKRTKWQRVLGIQTLPSRSEAKIMVPRAPQEYQEAAKPWPKKFFEYPESLLVLFKRRQLKREAKLASRRTGDESKSSESGDDQAASPDPPASS